MEPQVTGYISNAYEVYDRNSIQTPEKFDIYRYEFTHDQMVALVNCVKWYKENEIDNEIINQLPNMNRFRYAVKGGIRFEFAYVPL